MSLEAFRQIFWLEYLHRLLGRLVGLILLLPLGWFWLRGRLPAPLHRNMLLIALLVGMQGVAGWFMVHSGLVDQPRVSPYLLAFHLGMAVAILSALIHVLVRTHAREAAPRTTISPRLARFSLWVSGALLVQILMGALVAGLDAGLTYNTFPLMDGELIPSGMWTLHPWPRNLFETVATVQFQHRWMGMLVLSLIAALCLWIWRQRPDRTLRRVAFATLGIACAQVTLGITTLLMVVPLPLASLHQAIAMVLIGFCVLLNHMLYSRR